MEGGASLTFAVEVGDMGVDADGNASDDSPLSHSLSSSSSVTEPLLCFALILVFALALEGLSVEAEPVVAVSFVSAGPFSPEFTLRLFPKH
jgi:hypothetical protein